MRAVVIGGGKVGSYLVRELRRSKFAVIVIERSPVVARRVAEDTGALVIEGDGTDVDILTEADVRRAGYVIAVTGSDEDNLVACQLARTAFGCPRVLARVNNPRNERTFAALEVPWVSVTDTLVQIISQQLDVSELIHIATLGDGQGNLIEIEVPQERDKVAVQQLGLPESTVLAGVRRGRELIIPNGTTVIGPGDKVIAVTLTHLEDDVRDAVRDANRDRAVG